MFHHAMIAVDLDSQVPLLDCAPDLATWGVKRVSLLHLMKVGYAQGPGLGDDARHRQSLESLAEPLRARGLEVDIEVATAGDGGAAIAARAQDAAADLLVVGDRSHNVLGRIFPGSVARKVLRRASVPVLIEWIEPADGDGGRCHLSCSNTLRHVLVASDLTAAAPPVHEAAVALAALGAHVDPLHVASPETLDRFAEWPAMVEAAVTEVNARVVAAGGKGETFVVEGEPREEVLRLATERDVSLLVVGRASHDRSSIGSTARALSKQAGRPVLVIPNR